MDIYVPYRPAAYRAPPRRIGVVPYRSSGLGFLGDTSTLLRSAGGAYTGAGIGTAAGSIIIGGGTSVASAVGAAAAAGSFVPVIGTAIGLIVGLVASGVFNHRVDPEVGNFNNAVALYNQQGANGILNIADKYLVLAGLFDLEPGQIKGNIPIYKKYGRMGEERFVNDMVRLVYNAAQSGQIGPSDTVDTVWSRIVLPWINGFGYGAMSDSNGDMINTVLLGLIAEYVTGLYKTRWFARGGDFPASFSALPPFSIPPSANAGMAPAGTPVPVNQLPTQALPTNSTPLPPPPPVGTPAWMLSSGYSIIGTDPTYGNIYRIGENSSQPPVVLVNGQVKLYSQLIPSLSSQLPSAVSVPAPVPLPASPLPPQQALPAPYMPQMQFSGGGPVPFTSPFGSDGGAAAQPVQPAAAGLVSSSNPWVIAAAVGVGVMLLMGMKQHETTQKVARK